MNISDTLKGSLYALVAVVSVSNVYIFSKAALQETSISQFGVYWFGFGLLWILLFAFYKRAYPLFRILEKKDLLIMLVLGLFDVGSTFFFFKAIATISDPTIVSFIGNISPALAITLSIIVLKEKFNLLEVIGVTLALSGAFIISYKGNIDFSNLFIKGSEYVLYGALISSFNSVVIKKNIKRIPPVVLTVNRTFFLLTFSLLTLLYLQKGFSIPTTALKNIFIGSILGPFLTVIAGYLALQYIPLSLKSIFGSTKGLFVLIGSYIYFGNFPSKIALLGGLVSIIGVLLITLGKIKLKKKRQVE